MQLIQLRFRTMRQIALVFLLASSSAFAADTMPPQASASTTTTPPDKVSKKHAAKKAETDKAASVSPAIPIPRIIVTAATRNPQSINSTATSSTVLTRDQLDAQRFDFVSGALSFVPGLSVVPTGAPGQQTSVFTRGTDSNMTLFLIDGRRQPVGLDGAYDFADLTLDNIDRIEIVRTPSSSLEGGNATGGLINLVTLSGRGLSTPQSSVSFEGGSYDTFRENAQGRGAEGAFDYAVSASNFDGDMNRFNENFRNDVYRGNFGYQATPDIYFDLHTGYSLANAGSPNTIETPDPIGRLQTEDWFLSPEVTAKVTDFYTTKFYFTHDQTRQNFHDLYMNFDTFQFPTSQRLQINTESIDWQNNFQIARHWAITAGIQGDDSGVYQFDDLVGARTLQNSLTNIGGYAESEWEPLTGLNVVSSIRDDHYSDFSGALSWRQGVSYLIAPTQTAVHASGASSYTPPSLSNLYYPGFSNPDLKPETSLGWEVGAEQPLADGKVTPSVTYFHNDITDYIQYDANFIPQNIGKATTEGTEIDLKSKPLDDLTLDLNYTYLRADNDSAGIRLLRRPRNSLNFTGIWNPIAPLTLTAGGSWVVDRQDYDPTTFAQVKAPDYFVFRASASWRIDQYVTIWVRGENLGDRHYQPVLGYPALGAAGYGGIKVSF